MPAMGMLVLVLALIGGVLLYSGDSSEANSVQVSGSAGVEIEERKSFKYKKPVRSQPEEVRAVAEPPTIVPRTSVPIILRQPEPEPEPAPVQDPAVSACLGKVAGNECTFTTGGAVYSGTCRTPSWSPLTCEPN